MNSIIISCGLLIALFAILLLYRMLKLQPQVAGYGSQRMCPYCGLITSRLKAYCMECGQSLTAVSVTQLLSRPKHSPSMVSYYRGVYGVRHFSRFQFLTGVLR